jgi:hypothetical protein
MNLTIDDDQGTTETFALEEDWTAYASLLAIGSLFATVAYSVYFLLH